MDYKVIYSPNAISDLAEIVRSSLKMIRKLHSGWENNLLMMPTH